MAREWIIDADDDFINVNTGARIMLGTDNETGESAILFEYPGASDKMLAKSDRSNDLTDHMKKIRAALEANDMVLTSIFYRDMEG